MTYKVGPKGQVVVPKRIRDRLGIKPGDEVIVEEGDGEVRIRRVEPPESLRGVLKESGFDSLRFLEEEHRREIARDEERARRFER